MLSNKFNYDAYPQPLQLKLFLCKYRKKISSPYTGDERRHKKTTNRNKAKNYCYVSKYANRCVVDIMQSVWCAMVIFLADFLCLFSADNIIFKSNKFTFKMTKRFLSFFFGLFFMPLRVSDATNAIPK